MQATLRDQPMIQAAVGRAEADLRSGRAFLAEAARELWTETASTGSTSQERRAVLRLAATHGIRLAVQVVDTVYNAAGVTSIYEGNPIQRYFQDIHVISQHIQARLSHYELVGQHWLGVNVDLTRP
jgi:alkylation response protein AidB-like acyl-CoA dehydrogenase